MALSCQFCGRETTERLSASAEVVAQAVRCRESQAPRCVLDLCRQHAALYDRLQRHYRLRARLARQMEVRH